MVSRRNPRSAAHSRKVSRQINDSTIGSHVQRREPSRGRHAVSGADTGTSRVDFSNARRTSRARQGMVSTVAPRTSSGESDADYTRRSSRRGYVQQIQAQNRRRTFLVVAVLVAIVLAVALIAGVTSFFAFSDSRLSLDDSNASEALVAPSDNEPYYVLMAGRFGTAVMSDDSQGDAYMAVRVDEGAKALTFVSVPATTLVELSDGNEHPICEARDLGGDKELIEAVHELLGIDIAHFVYTDAKGLEKLVDIVGGVPVALTEEVDDPQAGVKVLAAGEQTLDGEGALTMVRAYNFSDPFGTQAINRAAFTVNLAQRATSGEALSFPSAVGDAAGAIATDLSSSQIIAIGDVLKPFADDAVYVCAVPGTIITRDGEKCFEVTDSDLSSVMDAVRNGKDPASAEGTVASVSKGSVTVEVRNGSGITGAAARLGDQLSSSGYKVEKVGNVDDNTVYPETLVIYKKPENENAAKAVVADMGGGRVVNGGDFYTFTDDVLVVVGTDWVQTG